MPRRASWLLLLLAPQLFVREASGKSLWEWATEYKHPIPEHCKSITPEQCKAFCYLKDFYEWQHQGSLSRKEALSTVKDATADKQKVACKFLGGGYSQNVEKVKGKDMYGKDAEWFQKEKKTGFGPFMIRLWDNIKGIVKMRCIDLFRQNAHLQVRFEGASRRAADRKGAASNTGARLDSCTKGDLVGPTPEEIEKAKKLSNNKGDVFWGVALMADTFDEALEATEYYERQYGTTVDSEHLSLVTSHMSSYSEELSDIAASELTNSELMSEIEVFSISDIDTDIRSSNMVDEQLLHMASETGHLRDSFEEASKQMIAEHQKTGIPYKAGPNLVGDQVVSPQKDSDLVIDNQLLNNLERLDAALDSLLP